MADENTDRIREIDELREKFGQEKSDMREKLEREKSEIVSRLEKENADLRDKLNAARVRFLEHFLVIYRQSPIFILLTRSFLLVTLCK